MTKPHISRRMTASFAADEVAATEARILTSIGVTDAALAESVPELLRWVRTAARMQQCLQRHSDDAQSLHDELTAMNDDTPRVLRRTADVQASNTQKQRQLDALLKEVGALQAEVNVAVALQAHDRRQGISTSTSETAQLRHALKRMDQLNRATLADVATTHAPGDSSAVSGAPRRSTSSQRKSRNYSDPTASSRRAQTVVVPPSASPPRQPSPQGFDSRDKNSPRTTGVSRSPSSTARQGYALRHAKARLTMEAPA